MQRFFFASVTTDSNVALNGLNRKRNLPASHNVQQRNEKPLNVKILYRFLILNPLRPNNNVSQTSHCNFKGVSVSEVDEN